MSPRPTNDVYARAGVVLVAALLLTLVAPMPMGAESEPTIGGLYELVLGVDRGEALSLIAYLERFGYRVDRSGVLDAEQAAALYGHRSAVEGVRLAHREADHGLYRLLIWDTPRDDGLGLSPMKVIGGRWGAAVTRDVYTIVNHAEDAVALGHEVLFVPPQRQVIYAAAGEQRPFLDDAMCVREMLLIRPHTRQILFQRYGYTLPLYGRIAEDAPLATSQVTHAGLVVQGGHELTDFYEDVLGLLRARDGHVSDDSDEASRNIFALEPGERYATTDFDDPRSVPTDLSRVRSGRLKIVRFLPDGPVLPDLRARSRPGGLGLTLYTYRVTDLEHYHGRVSASEASAVTAIANNELGEPSFSFVAPDGYFWTLIQD